RQGGGGITVVGMPGTGDVMAAEGGGGVTVVGMVATDGVMAGGGGVGDDGPLVGIVEPVPAGTGRRALPEAPPWPAPRPGAGPAPGSAAPGSVSATAVTAAAASAEDPTTRLALRRFLARRARLSIPAASSASGGRPTSVAARSAWWKLVSFMVSPPATRSQGRCRRADHVGSAARERPGS